MPAPELQHGAAVLVSDRAPIRISAQAIGQFLPHERGVPAGRRLARIEHRRTRSPHHRGRDRSGLVSFHGPMVATALRLGESGYNRTLLLDVLSGKLVRFPLEGTRTLQKGTGEGRLIGGCLSLVVATLGTKYEIDTTDSILVIEDQDTKPYQVDRMLIQLKHAGKLDNVRGIVIGEMLNCIQNSNQGYALEDVMLDILSDVGCPILFGFPTGHVSGAHAIVPFGVRARLHLGSEGAFELLEPAVAVQ